LQLLLQRQPLLLPLLQLMIRPQGSVPSQLTTTASGCTTSSSIGCWKVEQASAVCCCCILVTVLLLELDCCQATFLRREALLLPHCSHGSTQQRVQDITTDCCQGADGAAVLHGQLCALQTTHVLVLLLQTTHYVRQA
jgi:hypothetical protein